MQTKLDPTVFVCVAVSGIVLQCGAVCCSATACRLVGFAHRWKLQWIRQVLFVVQWVAVCCSVLQRVAVLLHVKHWDLHTNGDYTGFDRFCIVLHWVSVCCSILQCVAVLLHVNHWDLHTNGDYTGFDRFFVVLQCVAIFCVALCCSVLQLLGRAHG